MKCANLSRAIDDLKAQGLPVDDNLLEHLSPLGWEHINLTGDYVWRQNRRVESGKFRPLRPVRVSIADLELARIPDSQGLGASSYSKALTSSNDI